MIILKRPKIRMVESGVRLEAEFSINGIKDILWYEVEEKYSEWI